jgi:nitrogen-specific signal transduction histidine kinase
MNTKKKLARVRKMEQKFCGMIKNGSHAKNGKRPVTPAFVIRAERAFSRVARKVRAENHRLGLPLLVWSNGKTVLTKA